MNTTWDTLAPLSRRGWLGDVPLWDALLDAAPVVKRAVGRVWRHAAPGQLAGADELFQETVCLIADRAHRRSGLTDARDWGQGCPERWLHVVAQNAAIDALRRGRDRFTTRVRLSGDEMDNLCAVRPRLDEALDLAREIAATAEPLPPMPPLWRLAWLALERPGELDEAAVQEAGGAPDRSRGGNAGLARAVGETWWLLQAWRDTHGDRPKSAAARLGLAWILRTDDSRGATGWHADDPGATSRARDVVRQWHTRAVSRIKG